MTLGERLKALRFEQGLTQAGFASKVGLPLPTYRQYERDLRRPKIEVIKHICSVFNKDVLFFAEDYLIAENKKNNLFYFLFDDKPELAYKLTQLEISKAGTVVVGNKVFQIDFYEMELLRSALQVVFNGLEKL